MLVFLGFSILLVSLCHFDASVINTAFHVHVMHCNETPSSSDKSINHQITAEKMATLKSNKMHSLTVFSSKLVEAAIGHPQIELRLSNSTFLQNVDIAVHSK